MYSINGLLAAKRDVILERFAALGQRFWIRPGGCSKIEPSYA
jgi:hypothetical protein